MFNSFAEMRVLDYWWFQWNWQGNSNRVFQKRSKCYIAC